MTTSRLPELATVGVFAFATIVVPSVSPAQVPIIDGTRLESGEATRDSYRAYQADTQGVKGASGETVDSVAPGLGSGTPADCSPQGMSGATAPAGPSKKTVSQQEVARMVETEANRQGVDPNFAMAIAEQESRFHQSARSGAGAIGVMQLMPGTAAGLGVDPYDSRDNIRGGIKYIKQLQGMFGDRYDLIAAGYNAGPYRQSLQDGQIPNITETQHYVKSVAAYHERNEAKNGARIPMGTETSEAELINDTTGCGDQLKRALDRNTRAQLHRATTWNAFNQTSLEANRQHLQRLQAGLRSSSASLRALGGGNSNNHYRSLVTAQIRCPTTIIDTGSTRCFAVPANATTEQIQRWLEELQEMARANGNTASFSAMQDLTLGLVTIVDARPIEP